MSQQHALRFVNRDAEIYYYMSNRHANDLVKEEALLFMFAARSKIPFVTRIRQWLTQRSLAKLVQAGYLVCQSEGTPALGVVITVPELKTGYGWHSRSYKLRFEK